MSSPSSDPGLSRDTGSGARRICQPPLPRRRHPKSQTPLAEEWHGSAAEILQTALSHRWVLQCFAISIFFALADSVCHSSVVKWFLPSAQYAATTVYNGKSINLYKPPQCIRLMKTNLETQAAILFKQLFLLKSQWFHLSTVIISHTLSVYLHSVPLWWNHDWKEIQLPSFTTSFCSSDNVNILIIRWWMRWEIEDKKKYTVWQKTATTYLGKKAFLFYDTLSISERGSTTSLFTA